MKSKYLIANWKMNMNLSSVRDFARNFHENWKTYENGSYVNDTYIEPIVINTEKKPDNFNLNVVFCPPFLFLDKLINYLGDLSHISLGAQDCSSKENSALTGEISAQMISDFCDYIIIGHSERRMFFGENDSLILEKIKICLKYDLRVVLCCGENLNDREKGLHLDVIEKQLSNTLFKLDNALLDKVIIAYEPVWAIGTGKSAQKEEINEVHDFIRSLVDRHKSDNNISILYGGSCNQDNIWSIVSCNNVDGALVGSASLNDNNFLKMIKSFSRFLNNGSEFPESDTMAT
tara:strand:- start:694 stop:1563 length:870 start_codon:yes stop_codon:yes gene_type:complete